MNQDKTTLTKQIATGTGWLTAGEILAKFFSLLSLVVLARALSLAEYGTYRLVFAVFGLIYLLAVAGINSFTQSDLSYELGKGNKAEAKSIFLGFVKFKLFIGVLLFAVLFWGADLVAEFYSERIGVFLRLISPVFLISIGNEIVKLAFSVDRNFKILTFHNVIGSLGKLIFVFVFVASTSLGIVGAILAYIGSVLLPLLIVLPKFFKTEVMKTKTESGKSSLISAISRHGKWAIGESYFNGIERNISPLLVKFFLGTEAVAIISIAETILAHASSLISLKPVLMPIVPREIDNPVTSGKIFAKGIKYNLAMNLVISLGLIIAMPLIISIALPKYSAYIGLFQLILFSLIPLSFSSVITVYYYALKLQKDLLIFTLIRAVFSLGLISFLAKFLGLLGLVIENIITSSVFQIMRFNALVRKNPNIDFSIMELFKFDDYDRFIITKLKNKILKP